MKRRLLSALLVLALVLSMVPVTVSAEGVHTPGTHDANSKCEKCSKTVTWTAWGDDPAEKTSLPATGHYYLVDHVDMSKGTRTVASNLCLCRPAVSGKWQYRAGGRIGSSHKSAADITIFCECNTKTPISVPLTYIPQENKI